MDDFDCCGPDSRVLAAQLTRVRELTAKLSDVESRAAELERQLVENARGLEDAIKVANSNITRIRELERTIFFAYGKGMTDGERDYMERLDSVMEELGANNPLMLRGGSPEALLSQTEWQRKYARLLEVRGTGTPTGDN